MAKSTCERGCRLSVDRFSIPRAIGRMFRELLLVFALMTEQCAIAIPHQSQPRLDQANGTAAQIVRFPASIGDAMLPKQALRDFAIFVSL